ncbi:MarR family winged helix-turn-helix transcriptional regulator [Azospirillum halopraeferens]|uniref:MarR family winged helix-turn-helix transcriptional regulator n=1 Tax=Azospirillum halopraeferens TaxID=34010 RepID=UPI0006840BCA|nr:MarR family transcriptional regulator [Azospirillum halopraeferens]
MSEAPTPRRRRAPAPAVTPAAAAPAPAAAPEPAAPETAAGDDAVDLGILAESTGFLLKRAQMAVFHDFIRTCAVEDVRPAQFSVLIIIDRNPGLKQSQVSRALSIKRTNFVPLLDGLEERGLVRRKPAPNDRRSYALHLTAKGRALTDRLKALWTEHETRMRERIGEPGCTALFAMLNGLVGPGDPAAGDDADAAEEFTAAAAAKPRRGGSPRR